MIKIVIASKSDLQYLSLEMAEKFGQKCQIVIASAHRSPNLVKEIADSNCDVFIAAAGGAAHLAGVIASHTIKPVIGVPIETKLSGGLDSLLSTVQMPKGIPVATVGVNNFGNAILLAVQILAVKDESLADKLRKYKQELEDNIRLTTL